MNYDIKKLADVYEKHGNIIIGVDFDDTVFPFSTDPYVIERCERAKKLLKQVEDISVLCLYSVADDQSLVYKKYIMETWFLSKVWVNESPKKIGNNQKPYFNLLLDDKAGLTQALDILEEFIEHVDI